MPANSLIVGVDLAPIKPIPRTITFQEDITSEKCRSTIRSHLKAWKADTVLHDGAPNVGTAWAQDAFSQAELALQATKLATDFLSPGGTFVTKVFRSKDYNPLLWVFNQLFEKVEATKPPSSRNVSAEIFVVCRGFRAPHRIDPRFLDPRAVFADLAGQTPNSEAKVFNPEKKKRKREGYDEGNYTQFKEMPATDFIQTPDPIAMLASLNRLTFEQVRGNDLALAALDRLPETTAEIKECCFDLQVLGRKEFRMLLRWRLKVRQIFGLSKSSKSTDVGPSEVAEVTPIDGDLQIQEELHSLNEKGLLQRKRERRRENSKRQKELVRTQMHMHAPTDIGLEQNGPIGQGSIFSLADLERAKGSRPEISDYDNDPHGSTTSSQLESDSISSSDEEEDRLDRQLDNLYKQYTESRSKADSKSKIRQARRDEDGEWSGFSDDDVSADNGADDCLGSASSDSFESTDKRSTLLGSCRPFAEESLNKEANLFFDQDIFKEIEGMDVDQRDGLQAPFDNFTISSPKISRKLQAQASSIETTSAADNISTELQGVGNELERFQEGGDSKLKLTKSEGDYAWIEEDHDNITGPIGKSKIPEWLS